MCVRRVLVITVHHVYDAMKTTIISNVSSTRKDCVAHKNVSELFRYKTPFYINIIYDGKSFIDVMKFYRTRIA